MTTSFVPLTGGCKCGQVRFRMETAPIITHCCHCRDCQKVSGSAFRVNAMIETDRLTVFEGEAQSFRGKDGQNEVRCPDCGSSLWSYIPMFGEAIAFVGVGMLDEGERLAPQAHYFTRSRHPWVTLPPDLPSFEALGRPQTPGAGERIAAAMGATASGPLMAATTAGAKAGRSN